MEEYKKTYRWFIIWLISFFVLSFAVPFMPFVPKDNIQILIAVYDNFVSISCFILAWLVYRQDTVYWYNGISFEEARAAGRERRDAYALGHVKLFGQFALGFLVYSLLSIFLGIPYGIDITVLCVGLVWTAFRTTKVKL